MNQHPSADAELQRIKDAKQFRHDAAVLAETRAKAALDQANGPSLHVANGDEVKFKGKQVPMSFTKGLKHDPDTGLVHNEADFDALRAAIDGGLIAPFNDISVPRPPIPGNPDVGRRQWEAPTAGFVFDLEGPDAQAVTMQPAPAIHGGKDDPSFKELALEMAEVYELALLRDVPLTAFSEGSTNPAVQATVGRMQALAAKGIVRSDEKRPSHGAPNNDWTAQNLFRGSSPGTNVGPYLSQFMLIGNPGAVPGATIADGLVAFGNQVIDQRVKNTPVGQDYMITQQDWLDVQNGANVRNNAELFGAGTRFIHTPRDLATFVHDDALYQAYLNACLILLGMGAPLDRGFGHLSGQTVEDPNITGFALYGGPHILSLMTEVATRGLKAVRYQKFNVHLRARPEVLAARVACASAVDSAVGHGTLFQDFAHAVGPVADAVAHQNKENGGDHLALLPMAFQEGSPMHPTYGAGHATVAGACVTML
ncbi:MAG: bromoperoxidase, partial [Pseudomonadota bacterium]